MSIKGGLFDVVQIIGTDPVVAAFAPAHDGYSIKPVSGYERIYSAGQHTPHGTFPTEVNFTGLINFKLDVTTIPLFALAIPVAPTTPPPAMIYGKFTFDDGEWVYACQATGFKASLQQNKGIPCTLDFICSGRTASTLAGVSITPLTDAWIAKSVVLTGFPTGKSTDGLDITIANKLLAIFGMCGTTRGPDGVVEDYQDVTCDIKFNENHDVDVALDALAVIPTATVVMLTKSGADGGTFTLTNVLPADDGKDSKPGDANRFGLKYAADTIALEAAGE